MRHHIVLSGSFSTGKSSLMRALREAYPKLDEDFLIIEDGGRWWLNKLQGQIEGGFAADTLDIASRRQMQMAIFEHYIQAIHEAERLGKRLLTDAFFAEVLAYSIDCVSPEELTRMEITLAEHGPSIRAYLLPTTHIPLDKDGVRHEDEKFRESIEQTVLKLYEKHGVQCQIAQTNQIMQRLEDVLALLEVSYAT